MSIELTEQERGELSKLLSSPLFFPDIFKTWLNDWVATNIPLIPFHLFLGAKLNIAKSANFIATQEGTTSATYTDLTTVGPTISGLVNGDYIIVYGAAISTTDSAAFSISLNGAAASDDQAGQANWDETLARAYLATLKNDNNNSVRMKYRSVHGGLTKNFKNRWIAAIRVATG